jgi:kynurenine formamidase
MYKVLSYPIDDKVPTWPESPQLSITKHSQIAHGDAANTCIMSIFDHIGTHYDAPNHFVDGGVPIAQLPLERFIYERPLLLDIPKEKFEKISAADLKSRAGEIAQADFLLLRTGFSRYRKTDIPRFEREGPAIGSDCAEYLVDTFKNLSAVAVDFVSIASFGDQEDGNKTHRLLLGAKGGHFICAIEDVNMEGLVNGSIKRIFALPLFIIGTDSCPVTVLAELESTN